MTVKTTRGRPRLRAGQPTDRLASVMRAYRSAAGLSRDQLAARAGMSVNTLMSIEQGRSRDPGFFRIATLCSELKVGLDELLRQIGPRPQEGTRMSNGIVSAGYEGRSIEQFVSDLSTLGVSTVADVRLNAISRKSGFSKSALRAALQTVGIDYLHLPSLGNPKENREPFWSGRVDEGQRVFRERLDDPAAERDLEILGTRATNEVVAVLCFESSPGSCHRQVVIDEVAGTHALPVVDLD